VEHDLFDEVKVAFAHDELLEIIERLRVNVLDKT
jgi:hypothetical protein